MPRASTFVFNSQRANMPDSEIMADISSRINMPASEMIVENSDRINIPIPEIANNFYRVVYPNQSVETGTISINYNDLYDSSEGLFQQAKLNLNNMMYINVPCDVRKNKKKVYDI
ncbi:MAG: hypothetical protein LBF97_02245 [Elusimicrobiota bacterium]|jgi:hypothetical protein|nr:hypothetical protein [Elusimicrobiota bacterium]